MLFLDYLHVLCLVGVSLYVWRREPPRLLLTPLMLLGFFVLYGVGDLVYFGLADTVSNIRFAVTLSLIFMWIGLVLGIELARASMPGMSLQSRRVLRTWRMQPLVDHSAMNQVFAALGVLSGLFILGMFLGLGKPGQLMSFVAFESVKAKQKYRLELGGQGGYLYQTMIASVGPFLSFLLLTKGAVTKRPSLIAAGALLCVAVFAGKIGTFQKIAWVVYALQLAVVYQAARRLEIGVGRILAFVLVLLGGALAATAVAMPGLDASRIFGFLAYRFFEVNDEVVYQTFYVYPQHLPHTLGMNIGLIHNIFGSGELTSAHTQVANFFGAEGATFDAFFIADAWVDFGYLGVVGMSLLVGFAVKAVDMYVTSLGKTPLAVALLGSGMYGLFQLLVTSAFTAFLSGGLLFIPLLAMLSEGVYHDLSRGRALWQR